MRRGAAELAQPELPCGAEPLSAAERSEWDRQEAATRAAYAEAVQLLAAAAPALVFCDVAAASAPDTNPAACRALLRAGVPGAYDLARNALSAANRRRLAKAGRAPNGKRRQERNSR